MLSNRRMTKKPHSERRSRNGADDRRRLRGMNKKTITPDITAPMGRCRALAARFAGTIVRGGGLPARFTACG